MSTENLEIVIDATVQNGVKGVQNTVKEINKIPISAAKAGMALEKMGKSSGSAVQALTNVGRVAQDLPFGFIGIANNLNPLLESFQRLKAETGSTGGALKALGGSLVGAGGLGLALSAVTAAVTFAQMGFRAWGGSAKESAAKVKDAIGDISKSVATDLVQLQSYVGFATDVTKSYDERKKAVNALQKEYPQYLKNVSDEAILTGQATDAINASIDALLRKATLSLIKDEIAAVVAESAKQILTIEKAKIATEQATRAEQERAKGLKGETDAFEKADMAARQSGKTLSELPAQYQKLASASNQAFANRPDEKIKQIKEDLIKLVQPLVNAAVNFEDLGGKAEDGIKKAGKAAKDLKELHRNFDDFAGAIDFSGSLGKNRLIIQIATAFQQTEIKKNFEDLVKFVNEQPKPTVQLKMDADIQGVVDALAKATKEIQDKAEAFRQRIATILKDIVVDGVVSIAEGLGNALSGMKNPFGGLLSVLGNGLVTLGKMVIQTFVTLEALKKVLDSVGITNPVVGIAIGAAMVALGTVLKNKVNSTKFAEGGIVSGPMNAQIGEAGQSEVILPLSRLSGLLSSNRGMVVMETRVSGQDLLLVQARASGSRGRTYG